MTKDLIPISFKHENACENLDEDTLWAYAERVYREEECSSPEEFFNDMPKIEYFPDITFHTMLETYFSEQGKNIEDEVRGYAQHKAGFLMMHGCGYSWMSSDLFGGSTDGTEVNKFEEWLGKKGMYLV